MKGHVQIPKWLSPGAQNMIKRILDPNPATRITMAGIKEDEWFRQGLALANPDDEEEDIYIDNEAFSIHDEVCFLNFQLPPLVLDSCYYSFSFLLSFSLFLHMVVI